MTELSIRIGDKRVPILDALMWCEAGAVLWICFARVILGNDGLVSLGFTLSFLFACAAVLTLPRSKWKVLALPLLAVVCVLVDGAKKGVLATGLGQYKKIILFISTFMYAYVMARSKVMEKTRRMVLWAPLAAGVLCIFSYFVLRNDERIAHAIILNFPNSNALGMWLYTFIFFGVIQWLSAPKRWVKISLVVYIGLLIVLLLESRSRAGLMAVLFFAGIVTAGWLVKKIRKSKEALMLLVFIPLMFVLVYTCAMQMPWLQEAFGFMASEGKPLDSRSEVWAFSLLQVKENPAFGSYWNVQSHPLGQMHNIYMDVFASYGIFFGGLFMTFLYLLLERVAEKAHTLQAYVAICAFAAIWFVGGMFEAGILTGCTGLSYLSGMLLLIANNEKKHEERPVDEGKIR